MRRTDHRIAHRRPELSQHFLRSPAVASAIVRRMRLPAGALVVEPGAGDGVLTRALVDAGHRVIAIEKDAGAYTALRARFASEAVDCVQQDFLDFPLPSTPYVVVANVPYNITAAILRMLLHAARPPDIASLIVQREAAEKFAGIPRETQFSLVHKPWFEFEIAGAVRRGDFMPPPRVASSLLVIRHRETAVLDEGCERRYRAFIETSFRYGAGDVSHALRRYLTARQLQRLARDLGFARRMPASQLTFAQWLAIFRFVEHECLGHDPTWSVRHPEQPIMPIQWFGNAQVRSRTPARYGGAALATAGTFSGRRRAGGGN